MDCLNPITLKSGITVPCGKCLNCLSAHRTEVSVRFQIHSQYYNGSPMMITLTYDNDHLIYGNDAVVYRPHVSVFLKAYKRKYDLKKDTFTYFGSSEYGDLFSRPHIHLVFFGDTALEDLFWRDTKLAEARLRECWPHGNTWCGVATAAGMHYVTKYLMKEDLELHREAEPFSIYSKNLGSLWFDTYECAMIRRKLDFLTSNKEEIYDNCPSFFIDDRGSLLAAQAYFERFVPTWKHVLDNGKVVKLPRYFRKRLVGSFENFKDNPLWLPNYIDTLVRSDDFYRSTSDIDTAVKSRISLAENHSQKIYRNLLKRKFDKHASL